MSNITIPTSTRDFAREAANLRSSLLGERYHGAILAKFAGGTEKALAISQFMNERKNFLVFLGNPGCGKTHICGALFEWALSNFPSFRYFKEKDLQEHLRKIMIEKGWDTHQELERLFESDVIFLDDIGKIGHTEHKENMLFDILDIRYNSKKPTIFTSNLRKKEFYEIYEPRLCSRLFASENIVIEAFDEVDFRSLPCE